jgi:prepilin-type N-terminal cleavage/methylation domain-containing protein
MSSHRRAFTLIETSLATVIVGVGVLASIEANTSFLQKNAWSTNTSTATFLANELREMTRRFPRHDKFSGGIYFEDPDAHTGFQGWGPETNEIFIDPVTLAIIGFDFDDLDDLDGALFGNATTTLPFTQRYDGPIDAFGQIINQTTWTGDLAVDENDETFSMTEWSQLIRVEKVTFNDFTTVLPDASFTPAAGGVPEIPVDSFPVRVTVTILYQGPLDAAASVVAEVSWIAPP